MKIVKKILVTGATGYIGGRLVPRLLEKGYQVRVFVRDPGELIGRTWFENVEVVEGDVLDPKTLPSAMQDVDAAYYMIHSMSKNNDFHERDITAAKNFGDAATHAGVKQLIYLGGLGDSEGELSEHLRSRQETGDALRRSGVPVTEFRAAVIVGSGSISFEMIRYLTERVPLMVCPRWVYTKVQPIAIRDVLNYLVSALETPGALGEIIEIGGQDLITYGDMMRGYANVRGLRRGLIPVPFLTPYLSSYWVHWVTPIPASIARPLIEGLRTEVIVKNDLAEKVFPDIQPIGYEDAVKRALDRLDASQVETSWSDSLFSSQQDAAPVQLTTQDGMIIENRQTIVTAAPEEVFKSFTRIGGNHGYGYMNWAWRLRGILDRFVGGVGFRRGRRDPEEMRVGDAVDFWRVETVEPGHLIRLRAEMKVPGDAWLQYKAQTMPDGKTQLSQTAFFAPKGLFGLLYWYILYPVHSLIFSGMIENLKRQAERSSIPVASKLSGY